MQWFFAASIWFILANSLPHLQSNNDKNLTFDQTAVWDIDRSLKSLERRDVSNNYCTGTSLTTYQDAYQDALAALIAAAAATNSMISYMNQNLAASGRTPTLTSSMRNVLYTFEVIYGVAVSGPGSGPTNSGGLARAKSTLTILTLMINAMSGTIDETDIHCDETFLQPLDKYNRMPPEPGLKYDPNNEVWYAGDCAADPDTAGWTGNPVVSGTQRSVTTFCPTYFTKWTQSQNTQNLQAFQRTTVPEGTRTLEDVKYDYLAGTIIHEFTHMNTILGIDDDKDDGPNDDSYGWSKIVALGSSDPKAASKNADSFAYFVIAVYLSNNAWYTGTAQLKN